MTRPIDAFPLVPTGAASAVGIAVGVGLVAWLGVRPPNHGETRPIREVAGSIREVPGSIREVPDSIREVAPGIREVAPGIREVAPAIREVAPPAPPVPTFGPTASGRIAITPGRVAYIRCDGLTLADGARCPRDAAMEQAVWAVVQTLPRCDDPPRELGQTDLRLDLHGAEPTDVHARDVPGAAALDSHKLLACLAGPLSHVRTTLHATRVVVSFRFATEAVR